MSNQTETSFALQTHLKEQNIQVEALRATLDDFIKKRENRSHFNQFAASYGEASWWKKAGIFITFLSTCSGVIYAAGISPLWILPAIGLYVIGIYFLSNHYKAHQMINTKTLAVLESILTESIESINALGKQLNLMTSACSTLYQSQEKEQGILREHIETMDGANHVYKKALTALAPLAHELNETDQTVYQKSQSLLAILDETHGALAEEKQEIMVQLSPKIDSAMGLFSMFQTHIASLGRHFQKNVIQISAFVSELDNLLCQLESKREVVDETHLKALEKTKGLMSGADDALERGMHFIEKSSKDWAGEAVPAAHLHFFRTSPNDGLLTKHGALSSCPQ